MKNHNRNNANSNWSFDRPQRSKQDRPERKMVTDGYEVQVRDNDVMKAWRKLKKKIKEARLMEELKDRQYYRKPSQIKQEKLKLKKRAIRKATKEAEDFRTMNGSRQR